MSLILLMRPRFEVEKFSMRANPVKIKTDTYNMRAEVPGKTVSYNMRAEVPGKTDFYSIRTKVSLAVENSYSSVIKILKAVEFGATVRVLTNAVRYFSMLIRVPNEVTKFYNSKIRVNFSLQGALSLKTQITSAVTETISYYVTVYIPQVFRSPFFKVKNNTKPDKVTKNDGTKTSSNTRNPNLKTK